MNNQNKSPRNNPGNRRSYQTPQSRQNRQTRQTPGPIRYKPRRKTPSLAKYGFRLLMLLFFFMTISAICLALFFFNLTGTKTPPDILYTVNYTQTKNSKPENIPLSYDIGFANGMYYIPVNNIMNNMEFILAGDKKEPSFIRSKSGEYIKFIVNSSVAYINDEVYHMPGPSFSDGENNIYVPLEFLENVFQNLIFSFDEKNKNKITLDVGGVADSCFKIQKAEKLAAVEESPDFGENPVNFKADLKEYEQYFNPPAGQSDEYLVLINQTNLLDPQDYVPPDLTDLADTRKDGRAMQQLRLYAAKALEAFLIEARANGHNNVTVTSAYRSYALQSQYFNEEADRLRPTYGDKAEEMTAVSIAYPGQSEHQSGLGVDMHNLSAASQNFGNEPEGKWLAENAHYFGFILRYPEDKTEITGIKYEPWHFRYVGRYHATKIYESGLCLEEYWEQYLKK